MKPKFLVMMIALLSAACFTGHAQSEEIVTSKFTVNFRVDKTDYDPNYMGNAESIKKLHHTVDSIGVHRIDSVTVFTYASPEGSAEHNKWLAEQRAKKTTQVISDNIPELGPKIHAQPNGESWGALRDYVCQDTKMTEAKKQRVLDVIDCDVNLGTKKWRMQHTLGVDPNVGDVYQYLLKNYYKAIRNATIVVFKVNQLKLAKVVIFSEKMELLDTFLIPEDPGIDIPDLVAMVLVMGHETLFAIKTNLAYDALTMTNIEVEVPIGKRYSVMVEDVFPWWEFSKNKYALQNWEMGIEFRYWFKEWAAYDRKLEGFFVGPYVMSAKYDIQADTQYCWQGYYWSAGATVGFAKSLGRKHWGSLEFSLSVGYLSASYQHYQPSETYDVLIRDKYNVGRVMYVGPTKAKVSLVVPFRFKTARSQQTVVSTTNELETKL